MQIPIQIKGLPIQLICCMETKLIGFVRTRQVGLVWEQYDNYNVIVDDEGLKFYGNKLAEPQEYAYNELIEWRDKKELIPWLQAQELVMPTFTQQNF